MVDGYGLFDDASADAKAARHVATANRHYTKDCGK